MILHHIKPDRAVTFNQYIASLVLFNRDLNRGCLIYMFSLHFLENNFLVNLRRQFRLREFFRVRKIFRTQVFEGFAVFSFCI